MIYNVKLLDFNEFFNNTIQKEILDTFFIYKLFDKDDQINLRNSQVKNIINYFIILFTSKFINVINNEKTVIVIQPNIVDGTNISNYCEINSLRNIIKKTLKILQNKYPHNIVLLKKSMDVLNLDTIKFIFNKVSTQNVYNSYKTR